MTLHQRGYHTTDPLRKARNARPDHAEGRLRVVGGELDDRRQPEKHPLPRPNLLVGLSARRFGKNRVVKQANDSRHDKRSKR